MWRSKIRLSFQAAFVIHQFSRVGRLAMIGGNTRVNLDVPPYFLYSDFNVAPKGLNLVGLRRAGFSHSDVLVLKQAYRLLYQSGLKLEDALTRIESECDSETCAASCGVRAVESSRDARP